MIGNDEAQKVWFNEADQQDGDKFLEFDQIYDLMGDLNINLNKENIL